MAAVPKVIPAEMLEWFNSPEGNWFRKELGGDGVAEATMRQGFDLGPIRRMRQVLAHLAAKDANFVFGTDTPSATTYGNLPA